MPKSAKVRKESSKREREEGRTSEGMNPFRKSSRTGRFPNRSKEGKDKKIKIMLREIREDTAGIRKKLAAVREENGELKIKLVAMRKEIRGREGKGQAEKADWMKRMKMIVEKMQQREKKERKNNVIII
jgi:regulator of replication initiation timing